MTTQQSSDIKQQVQQLRELYADAPETAKTALENVLRTMESGGRNQGRNRPLGWKAPAGSGAVKAKSQS
jgi:hypothetical protein